MLRIIRSPINCLYINDDIIMVKVIIPGTIIAIVAVISVSSTNPGIIIIVYYSA